MTERRYNEDDVAKIFELASQLDEERSLPAPRMDEHRGEGGLTAGDLRAIAEEVGISAGAMETSLQQYSHPALAQPADITHRLVGFPVGVGGTLELSRDLTDREWAELVSMARMEFNAHGKVDGAGALRSWRNGNLRLHIEPYGDGARVRMQTVKGQARQLMAAGMSMFGVGSIAGLAFLLSGDVEGAIQAGTIVTLMGAGIAGSGLLGLRSWAARRRAQMSRLVARAAELTRDAPAALDSGDAVGESGE